MKRSDSLRGKLRGLRSAGAAALGTLPGSSLQFGPPRRVAEAGAWLREHSKQGWYHALSSARETVRTPAVWADPPLAALFQTMVHGKIKPRGVAEILGGRSWGTGYGCCIAPDDTILTDVSLTLAELATDRAKTGPHEAQQRLMVPRPRRLSGTTLALHTYGHENYHHWLLDTLPAIGLFLEAGYKLEEADRILVRAAHAPFHQETFARLGIPPSKIVLQGANDHFICERLIVPTFSEPARQPELYDYTPEGLAFVRQLFLRNPAASPVRSRKIIVSREKARSRRLLDGEAIHAQLEHEGFAKVCLEDHPVAVQAAIFAQAEKVVMPTGGGLANIAFCAPGTRLVELFSPAYLPTFCLPLTGALGMSYVALAGEDETGTLRHSDAGGSQDMRIMTSRILEAAEKS